MMTLGIFFAPQSMSAERYDVMRQLEAAGHGAPAGVSATAHFQA
jgi:hypothetical protein